MLLGDLYARLTMLLAIGIVYSPLDPTLMLFCIVFVGINYFAIRYHLAHWAKKPKNITFSLCAQ